VLHLLLQRDGNRVPARTPARAPPETAKNHRVARKAAARQYLIPLFLSFFVSPFSSLRLFFFHWSLYSFLYSIPSTNSRGNPFSYSSYFTITISGSSRFSSPYSIRSLIKYICLTRTHTCEHAQFDHHTDWSDHSCEAVAILTTSYDCLRNSLVFFMNRSIATTRFWIFRKFTFFVLWNNVICLAASFILFVKWVFLRIYIWHNCDRNNSMNTL